MCISGIRNRNFVQPVLFISISRKQALIGSGGVLHACYVITTTREARHVNVTLNMPGFYIKHFWLGRPGVRNFGMSSRWHEKPGDIDSGWSAVNSGVVYSQEGLQINPCYLSVDTSCLYSWIVHQRFATSGTLVGNASSNCISAFHALFRLPLVSACVHCVVHLVVLELVW